MEDALRAQLSFRNTYTVNVLILVLMEDALRVELPGFVGS